MKQPSEHASMGPMRSLLKSVSLVGKKAMAVAVRALPVPGKTVVAGFFGEVEAVCSWFLNTREPRHVLHGRDAQGVSALLQARSFSLPLCGAQSLQHPGRRPQPEYPPNPQVDVLTAASEGDLIWRWVCKEVITLK